MVKGGWVDEKWGEAKKERRGAGRGGLEDVR